MISYPPTTSPQPPAPAPAPTPAPSANGRRYQIITGSVFAALTALALALAAIAPNLSPAPSQQTAGWSPIYEHDLTAADSAAWDLTHGCAFTAQGLDADASNSDAAICTFTPAGQSGATGAGFYFEVKLAPAAKVAAFQQALLLVGNDGNQSGDTLMFQIDQDGRYLLCDTNACEAVSQGQPYQGVYLASGTAAWHSDALVANTIALEVSADHSQEIFYVNGQQVASVSVDIGGSPSLAVGAQSGSEAIYTHATLSTGQ